MRHKWTTLLIVATLLLAAVVEVLPIRTDAADVNADGAINVRDVQMMLSGLQAKQPATRLDVTRDGKIDICDLQRLLAKRAATASNAPMPANVPASPLPDGIVPTQAPHWRILYTFALSLNPVVVEDKEDIVAPRTTHAIAHTLSQPKALHYLWGQSPNAPPHLA